MTLRPVIVRILRPILGVFFMIDGLIKLAGISQTVLLFEHIGWGQWFRYFTGLLVLAGGATILARLRATFYGTLVCAATVGTGALLYAFRLHRDPSLPAAITVLTLALSGLSYPERAHRHVAA